MGKTSKPGLAKGVHPEVKEIFQRAHAVNVSMLAVCRKAGVHHDVVGRWRRGQTSPTISTLTKIKRAIAHFERNPPVVPL